MTNCAATDQGLRFANVERERLRSAVPGSESWEGTAAIQEPRDFTADIILIVDLGTILWKTWERRGYWLIDAVLSSYVVSLLWDISGHMSFRRKGVLLERKGNYHKERIIIGGVSLRELCCQRPCDPPDLFFDLHPDGLSHFRYTFLYRRRSGYLWALSFPTGDLMTELTRTSTIEKSIIFGIGKLRHEGIVPSKPFKKGWCMGCRRQLDHSKVIEKSINWFSQVSHT
jgi:hypothetical protein